MRLRSFFGLLLAVAAAFLAAYHMRLNGELLDQRFRLGEQVSIPVWGALLGDFLAGFLPVAVTLVVDTLRHELGLRRERRRRREEESLEATFRRAGSYVPAPDMCRWRGGEGVSWEIRERQNSTEAT